jgi:hypothetical protein
MGAGGADWALTAAAKICPRKYRAAKIKTHLIKRSDF